MTLVNGQEKFLSQDVLIYMMKLYEKERRIAKVTEIAEQFKITIYKTQTILKILISQDLLDLKYNKYSFSEKVWDEINGHKKATIFTSSEVKQISLKKEKTSFRQKIENFLDIDESLVSLIIRVIMFLIGVSATYMSAYYTYNWALKYQPAVQAGILSGTVVLFASISFNAMVLLARKKSKTSDRLGRTKIIRPNLWIAMIFAIVYLISAAFSMTSTVAGLYNKRVETQKELIKKNYGSTYKQKAWVLYNNIGAVSEKALKDKQDEFDIMKKNWLNTDGSTTNKQYRDMKRVENELEEKRREVKSGNTQKISFVTKQTNSGAITETSIEIPTFYEWLAGIFTGISADMIEFILSLFPALFIDIIAPLALAISMFMRNGKKDETSPS